VASCHQTFNNSNWRPKGSLVRGGHIKARGPPLVDVYSSIVGWAGGGGGDISYMMCSVMTLQKAIKDNYAGFDLPSPAAAGIYVAIVLNHPSSLKSHMASQVSLLLWMRSVLVWMRPSLVCG
jgi:hypothetical protein